MFLFSLLALLFLVLVLPIHTQGYDDRCDLAIHKLSKTFSPFGGMFSFRYWNSAVGLNGLVDYMSRSGHRFANVSLIAMIETNFNEIQIVHPHFVTEYNDDMGWYGESKMRTTLSIVYASFRML